MLDEWNDVMVTSAEKNKGFTKVIGIYLLGTINNCCICSSPTSWDMSLSKWKFYLLVALDERLGDQLNSYTWKREGLYTIYLQSV